MHSETPRTKLSWSQIKKLAMKLANEVRTSGFKPEYLIGITVGGVFPLALLAKEFNTKDVAVVSARSYSKGRQGKLWVTALPKVNLRGKRVLLVDEIADRGTTLKHIAKIFVRQYKVREIKTASLIVNTRHCEHWPDYHVLETDRWVVFPWERNVVR